MEQINLSDINSTNLYDVSIPLQTDEQIPKKTFFHQYIAFQISKNPFLLQFARKNLIATHPRAIYNVDFNESGDMFITYYQNEPPVKYTPLLTRNLTVADVSWSAKYGCYFDYLHGAPFVIDSDIISLIYLAALEEELEPEIIGEWMRSATKGRYVGFNPIHLEKTK